VPFNWNTTGRGAGTYNVQVFARVSGSTATYQAVSPVTPYAITGGPAYCPTLTTSASPASPQAVGQTITLSGSATCSGGGTAEYSFIVLKPDNTYATLRGYGSSPYLWNTTGFPAGNYTVYVRARAIGSTVVYDTQKSFPYSLSGGPCAGVPNGTACDDGQPCTQTDTCQNGACVGSNPVICTASDQCHVAGTCNPATGACSNPSIADGTACVDGDACTQTDSCQAGVCTGGNPVTCVPLDQCHTAGTCNPATGICTNPMLDGPSCNDGNACTQTDVCQVGVCVGTNPVVCTASDQCHVAGTCDSLTGLCSNPAAADGTTCSDGSLCTQTDTCQAGTCVGGNPVVCLAQDQCHSAACNPSTGACSSPAKANGTSCNDGSRCTRSETCQAGVCSNGIGTCSSPLVIGKFRTRGVNGGLDEFVEIYNISQFAVPIGGYKLRGSNSIGTIGDRATVPAGTTIPPHGHYLFATAVGPTGYSGGTAANTVYGTAISDDGGIAFTDASNNILDQVGMSAGSAFKEGTVLTPLLNNIDVCWARQRETQNASPWEGSIDSNNNQADFFQVSPCGARNLASDPVPPLDVSTRFVWLAAASGQSASDTFTIKNNNSISVTIYPPFTFGTNASEFSATAGTITLAPGASTTVTVTMQPVTSGDKTATLQFAFQQPLAWNSAGAFVNVALGGNAGW
jgi:hypothetical protein